MKTTISTLKLKEAAIYSPQIIPVNIFLDYTYEVSKGYMEVTEYIDSINESGVLEEILPSEFANNWPFRKQLGEVNGAFSEFMQLHMGYHFELDPIPSDEDMQNAYSNIQNRLQKFIDDFALSDIPIEAGDALFGYSEEENQPALVLTGMNIIDTTKSEWSHILEFRRDREAASKLRNLRLQFYNNYQGKDRSFVEDDIRKRLDDYDAAIKDWGFETMSGSVGMLLSSKALAGGAIGSLVSVLAGAPISAAVSMSGAALLEAGRIGLHVQKQKFDLKKSLRDNPIELVRYAQKKLENK